MGGSLTGTVLDSLNRTPIEYATLMLFSNEDSSRITGVSTDRNGHFELSPVRPGSYFLRVSFLGYFPQTIEDIMFGRGSMQKDLGEILLVPTVLEGGEVTVVGEKIQMEYHLDKKVVNVEKMQSSVSGSAVDVLEQVPSVKVDIEGNVSLRGSENFTVLIDGRPSILDPSDALQQIPASTIESIEIITNPSAKYSPEGTAGILNIILSKQRSQGISGMVNMNGGMNNKMGGDISLTRRMNGITVTLAADYDTHEFPGDSESLNRTTFDGVTSNYTSKGSRQHERTRYGLRGEFEWKLSQKNLFSLGGRFGGRSGGHDSDLYYEEWTGEEPHTTYFSRNESERSGDFYSVFSYFRHKFASQGNELTANFQFRTRDFDEKSKNERFASDGSLVSGQDAKEYGPGQNIDIKLEYLREFHEDKKLETGYEGDINHSEDNNELSEYDSLQQVYVPQSDFERQTDYRRNVHALYAIYADDSHKLSYQIGIRGEYTDRSIELVETSEEFTIDRWDYFPSAHASYNVGEGRQLMASYSRRIHRARGWQLEPFETWRDAYNVRRGNPALEPEYIDSYEAGYLTGLLGASLSFETYYRFTRNRVEFIRSPYAENVTLMTFDNVGRDHSLGSEVQLDFQPWKLLETSLTGNFYDYRIEGDYDGRSFDEHEFSWDARLSNTFKFGKSLRWQLDAHYRSPQITSQGERKGFLMTNTSIRKEFLDNTLAFTLQVRDLFGEMKRESTSSGPGFYEYNRFEVDTPLVSLNVSYKFNNYKGKSKRNGDSDLSEGEDEF